MTILEFFEHLFEWNFYLGRGFEYAIIMYTITLCCVIIAISTVITAVCSILSTRRQTQLLTKLDRSVNDIIDQIDIYGRDDSEEDSEDQTDA